MRRVAASRERRLKRRVRRELRELQIVPPLRVDVLCARVGERRRRPIRLVAYPLPVPGPFGLWLAMAEADYVLYQRETSRVHQAHIVLHEVGHILADHQSDERDDHVWEDLLPNLSPALVRRLLRRTDYNEEQEREAELVATVIQEWAAVLDHSMPQMGADDPGVQRLQGALGDRQGWL